MSSCIILDTECTDLDAPDVIELAFVVVENLLPNQDIGTVYATRYHPRKAISPAAMAVHNIILNDLTDCPTWPGAWLHPGWEGQEDHFIIGHGVDFDYQAIGSPTNILLIDTLALSQFFWPDASHSLGAMIYLLMPADHARQYVKHAHGAHHDVGMTYLLLGFILDKAEEMGLLKPGPTFKELWELSELARIPVFMNFGKYGPHEAWAKLNGGPMRCDRIRSHDPQYYGWLLNKCDRVAEDPYLRKALTGE
jgi:exodeoxyribonuclease X